MIWIKYIKTCFSKNISLLKKRKFIKEGKYLQKGGNIF